MAEISFALNHLKINSKQSIIDTHLELMDLNAFSDHHPLKLSTGQKLRLALASILCLKPDLIILDEPVRGQDWGHLEAFMLFIREYIETGSRACILITHEFKVVHHFADKIALLKNGRLKKIGAVRKKH